MMPTHANMNSPTAIFCLSIPTYLIYIKQAMRLHPVIRRICASLATVFYISTSAAIGKTIEVYDVDDMLKACTNKAGGPFELILHNDIGVTGKNSAKKWTSEKSLYYRSNYTIKSASNGNYSVSFTGGNVSQLQEAFDLCDEVVFENLHNVTLGNCSDIASSKDFNDALSSGYDSETGALMNIDHVIFKDLTGKLQLSSLSFYSGGMGGDGMNAATATVSGIGLACSTAEFLNVAKGIEIKNIQVFDKITTWYPWQRWIEMSGVALCAKDVTFADNGTSIVFSGNFIEQARENKMEGMGQGAAAYITGTANFNNNAGSLTFSENHLNMATVGCGAALFLGTFSETTITGQHRDEAAGIDALISFSGNYVDILQNAEEVKMVFRNISAQELDYEPERLTERFVRGDASRNSEGSGLGLAIAKSFTELQGGKFKIEVDGDLFKVLLTWSR
jgi:hypothetical protein